MTKTTDLDTIKPNPVGRPFTERETLFAVCDAIAGGGNLRPSCEAAGIDAATFYNHIHRDCELFASYKLARHVRAGDHAESIIATAQRVVDGEISADAGRVAIDAAKWVSARWGRSEYGDSQHVIVEPVKAQQSTIDLNVLTDDELHAYELMTYKITGQPLPPHL